MPDCVGKIWRGIGFAHFPAPQCAYINAELSCDLALTVAATQTRKEMSCVFHGLTLGKVAVSMSAFCPFRNSDGCISKKRGQVHFLAVDK